MTISLPPLHPPRPRPRLDSLPPDILLRLARFLSLRSLARLASVSRSLAGLARSDLLWRPIVARLVGPWIHTPRLPSPLSPAPSSTTAQSHWTLESSFLPLLPQTHSSCQPSSSTGPSGEDPILSWYQYATRFLLPNFNYLGWHMSDQKPAGRLVLITLDVHTGRLVAEEILCLNVYRRSHYAPRAMRTPTPFEVLSRPFLPPCCPVPPAWLPVSHVHMNPVGTGYTMAAGHAHPGFQLDLFAPAYVSLPWFALAPLAPHCILAAEPARSGLAFSPRLSTRPSHHPAPPLTNAATLLARRTDIRERAVLAGRPTDMVTDAGADADALEHHSFAASPAAPPVCVPTAPMARIIYQDRPAARSSMGALWAGGRAYVVGAGGQLVECSGADDGQVGFHAIDGPSAMGGPPAGLAGLWVGCYGTHGCEFGKLVVKRSQGRTQVSFLKVTGDANVPAGEVSWTAEGADEEFKGISRARAVELDMGGDQVLQSEDEGWLVGKGRVANEMFREPQWINTRIQLIKRRRRKRRIEDYQSHLNHGGEDQDDDGENGEEEVIENIRVKWIELNHIVEFWKVLLG